MSCRAKAGNLYEVLGVPETATSKEIRAAYRKLAMKLHPDVNKAPDAKERFIECKTAYDTLNDDAQRTAYDRSRRGWARAAGAGGASAGMGSDFGRDWDSFSAYARKAATEAQAYTYSDLMRDLDAEIENWQKEREKKKGKRAETVSDVFGDLAEELLEFLEMGIDDGADSKQPGSRKPRSGVSDSFEETYDEFSRAREEAAAAVRSASADARRQAADAAKMGANAAKARAKGAAAKAEAQARTAGDRVRDSQAPVGAQVRADADAAARRARERAAEAARAATWHSQQAEKERKRRTEIEDELAALKRKMGM